MVLCHTESMLNVLNAEKLQGTMTLKLNLAIVMREQNLNRGVRNVEVCIAVLFVPIQIAFGETNTLNAKEQGNARGMMINIELGVEH